MSTTNAKRSTAARLDDGMARGMEMVLTPALLGLFGYVADRLLGTVPVFTIVAVVFGVVGMFVRSYYRYEAAMRAHEAEGPWRKAVGRSRPAEGP